MLQLDYVEVTFTCLQFFSSYLRVGRVKRKTAVAECCGISSGRRLSRALRFAPITTARRALGRPSTSALESDTLPSQSPGGNIQQAIAVVQQ